MFIKKQPCEDAMHEFWNWFKEKENWIVATCNINGIDVVNAVDKKLTPVFPYFKKEIEFQLGFNEGKGEFFFFDLKNKNLNRDAKKLYSLMPKDLHYAWDLIIDH